MTREKLNFSSIVRQMQRQSLKDVAVRNWHWKFRTHYKRPTSRQRLFNWKICAFCLDNSVGNCMSIYWCVTLTNQSIFHYFNQQLFDVSVDFRMRWQSFRCGLIGCQSSLVQYTSTESSSSLNGRRYGWSNAIRWSLRLRQAENRFCSTVGHDL